MMIYIGLQIMYGMIFGVITFNCKKALDTAVIAWYNNIIIKKRKDIL